MKTRHLALVALLVAAPLSAQTITGVNAPFASATLTANGTTTCNVTSSGCVVLQTKGFAFLGFEVTGTFSTATANFDASITCSTTAADWTTVNVTPINGTTAVVSTTSAGQWQGAINATCVRVRLSGGGTPSLAVVARATLAPTGASSSGGGGGGTPGGADTNVQYNDGGSFGGTAGFTFNKTSKLFATQASQVNSTAATGINFGSDTNASVVIDDATNDNWHLVMTEAGAASGWSGLAGGFSTVSMIADDGAGSFNFLQSCTVAVCKALGWGDFAANYRLTGDGTYGLLVRNGAGAADGAMRLDTARFGTAGTEFAREHAFLFVSGHRAVVLDGATATAVDGVGLNSTGDLSWSSTSTAGGSIDVMLNRESAGRLGVVAADGTTGAELNAGTYVVGGTSGCTGTPTASVNGIVTACAFTSPVTRDEYDALVARMDRLEHRLLTGVTVASGADLGSTLAVLQGGGHEANPILGSSVARLVAMKIGLTGLVLFGLSRAWRGSPHVAARMAWATIAVFSTVTAWNLR